MITTEMQEDAVPRFTRYLANLAAQLEYRPRLFLLTPFTVLNGERASRRAIATMREALSLCAEVCEAGHCMAAAGRRATIIRDNYARIVAAIEELPVPAFLKRRVEQSLTEWDDLVEDCAIGSDPEIRAALTDIAARL